MSPTRSASFDISVKVLALVLKKKVGIMSLQHKPNPYFIFYTLHRWQIK